MSTLKQDTRSRRVITVTHPRNHGQTMAALALKNFCEGKGSHNLNQVVGWVHATHGEQVGICVDTEAQAIKVVEYGQIGQFGFEKVVVYARLEFRIIPFVGETDWDIDLV